MQSLDVFAWAMVVVALLSFINSILLIGGTLVKVILWARGR
jgi:hypothetical protein